MLAQEKVDEVHELIEACRAYAETAVTWTSNLKSMIAAEKSLLGLK